MKANNGLTALHPPRARADREQKTQESEEGWGTGRDGFTDRASKNNLCSIIIIFGCLLMEKSSWMKMKVRDVRRRIRLVAGSSRRETKWSPSHFNYKQRS